MSEFTTYKWTAEEVEQMKFLYEDATRWLSNAQRKLGYVEEALEKLHAFLWNPDEISHDED